MAALFQCNALQAISITQLGVLLLQFWLGGGWRRVTLLLLLLVLILGPFVWALNLSPALPLALGSYLDSSSGSPFPLFPFASFVLAGTLAGSFLGREARKSRGKKAVQVGFALVILGLLLAFLLEGRVDFWGVSPAYVSIRLGGLLLLLRLVEEAARRKLPGILALALLGRETLLVYVLHLLLLFGGITGYALLGDYVGTLSVKGVVLVLLLMVPFLYLVARLWHAAKQWAPREAQLGIVFVTVAFLYEFMTRPW
jgi:hypothetical protein